MAKCSIKGLDELDRLFTNLEKIDEIAEEIVQEGGTILEKALKSEIGKAANRGYATGELERSIVATPPMKNHWGHYAVARPVGTDSKGVRNGEKWGYLEHGVKKGQQAHPFIGKAVNTAELKGSAKAQEIINKYTEK